MLPPARWVTLLVVVALVCGGALTAQALSGSVGAAPASDSSFIAADCNHPTASSSGKLVAQCFALVRSNAARQVTADATAPPAGSLGPADIQAAYKLPDGGHGQTVAIVDAYGDSHAESDLAAYRSYYNLPACTTVNGCFKKVDQSGGANYPADNTGWATETSLDLDAVSAACPACNILLVQGNSAGLDDLGTAVVTAVNLGAKFVSNSYGIAGENASETGYDHYYDHPGVVVAAATGDTGNVQNWPATDPNVTAVGGTLLTKDTAVPRGWTETAWGTAAAGVAGGGSGCSLYEPRPNYQLGIATNCSARAVADIAADADPTSGLGIYDTLGQAGWMQVGGTSLATPLITSMYALAGTPTAGTYPVTYPYHDPHPSSDLFDITTGTNGTCGNMLCQAGTGWDGPTGLGTPDGVAALAGQPQGTLVGQITDKITSAPVAGVNVNAEPGHYQTTTDATGHYTLDLAAGSYTITASKYGYGTATQSGLQVSAGQQSAENFTLQPSATSALSGTITDGSGHGWPLYAKITIPGTPLAPVYTDPYTGKYSVTLADDSGYTLHVTPVYGGYKSADVQVQLGRADQRRDITASADPAECTAPGYHWNGLSEDFTGWSGSTPVNGWQASGTRAGWRFDNQGNKSSPPGGDDNFAVADSAGSGSGAPLNTTLTSPTTDLSGQSAPHLSFDTAYYPYGHGQLAQVQLSTDAGRHWQTIWHQDSTDYVGHVDLPLPQAANDQAAQIRFHYQGHSAWWWAVDNVFLGTRTCVPAPGGLTAGVVSAQDTNTRITGATVTATATAASTYTVAVPDDAGNPTGFYWMFTPAGSQQFTATAPGKDPGVAVVRVTADTVTRQDFALTANGN